MIIQKTKFVRNTGNRIKRALNLMRNPKLAHILVARRYYILLFYFLLYYIIRLFIDLPRFKPPTCFLYSYYIIDLLLQSWSFYREFWNQPNGGELDLINGHNGEWSFDNGHNGHNSSFNQIQSLLFFKIFDWKFWWLIATITELLLNLSLTNLFHVKLPQTFG